LKLSLTVKKMTTTEFNEIINAHQEWLKGKGGGKCADLSGCEYFVGRYFGKFNLSGAILTNANFNDCNLHDADFSGCDLRGAGFRNAILVNADFESANLFGSHLEGAQLRGIKVNYETQGYFPICPLEGSFIGYKKLSGYIVVLKIPADAQRSSGTTFECRADKALTLRIENIDGTPADVSAVVSNYDKNFRYKVGETIKAKGYCQDRFADGGGIHFFISREMAVNYDFF